MAKVCVLIASPGNWRKLIASAAFYSHFKLKLLNEHSRRKICFHKLLPPFCVYTFISLNVTAI